jgi:hypothetical protein
VKNRTGWNINRRELARGVEDAVECERALEFPDDPRDAHLEPPLHVSQQRPGHVHQPLHVHAVVTCFWWRPCCEVRRDPGLSLQQLLPRGHHQPLQLERLLQELPQRRALLPDAALPVPAPRALLLKKHETQLSFEHLIR